MMLGFAMLQCNPVLAQVQQERFWLAGRYDGNRIVVYFQSVHFDGTLPPDAQKLPCLTFPPKSAHEPVR